MIILTSSVASVAGHIYKNYLSDKGYKSVLFVDTAAELEIGKVEGDDDWFQADLQSLKNQDYNVERFSVTGKTKEAIEKKIDDFDILYMSGGNTVYLLQQLQKTNSFNLISEKVKAGKTYIGTSAGSIIAGPKIPIYLEDSAEIKLADYTGFNFTNVLVVPHWGSPHFKDSYSERMKVAYRDNEPPFLLLNDYQYIVVDEKGNLAVVNSKE